MSDVKDTPGFSGKLQRWADRLSLNPVFLKEILVYERSASATAGRAAMLAAAMSLAVLVLMALSVYFPGPWRFAGRGIGLGVLALLAFASYGVMVPAATSIALERDRETFDTLTVSTLDASRLVRGKVFGAMAIGLMTKAPLLPAVGLAFLFGGVSLALFPAFLLVLLCVDLAYACLGVYISSRKHEPPRVQAFVKPPTQAQMSLQRGVGSLVFSSVVLLYGVAFIIPFSVQHGWLVASLVRRVAVVGIGHPVLCLLLWGPVRLFSIELPLWLLTALFHLLLAAPLFAKAVDSHRPPHSRASRGPRLLALPFIGFCGFCLLGALWDLGPRWCVLGAALLAGLVTMVWVVVVGFTREAPPEGQGRTRGSMLREAFLDLPGLIRSEVATAPGYLALHALLLAAILVIALTHAVGWGEAWSLGLRAGLGLLSFSVGLGLFGVTLNARRHSEEGQRLLEVLNGERSPESLAAREPEAAKPKGLRGLPSGLLVLSFALPFAAWVASRAAAAGSLPFPSALVSAIKVFGLAGVMVNPFASLLPILGEHPTLGFAFISKGLAELGAEPQLIYALHVVFYATLGLVAVVLLPAPPPTREAVLEALAEGEARRRAALAKAPPPDAAEAPGAAPEAGEAAEETPA